jgi:hypothetical protein
VTGLIRGIWRRITLYRHRSELIALRIANRVPFLAIVPIGAVCVFWWYVWCLPLVPPLVVFASIPDLTGTVLMFLLILPIMAMLFFATPWFMTWCLTAIGMTVGKRQRADAMEQYLTDSIRREGERRKNAVTPARDRQITP